MRRSWLVLDRVLGRAGHQEAERLLALLGQVGEQARGAGEDRHRLDGRAPGSRGRASRRRSASRRSWSAAGPRPRRRRRGPARASATCSPLTPRSSASSRIRSARGSSGLCTGWPKPGTLAAGGADRARDLGDGRRRCSSSRAHSSAVPRITGPAPRMPGRDGALQRARVGGQRHPRGDVGRHHPVLGDRDQQQVEEVALVVGRLVAGEQQVEVLGEGQRAHQVAGEVTAADLDPVGVGLADVGDGSVAFARHRVAKLSSCHCNL